MAGYDTLLNDPMAQLGYGLLVAGSPGGNIQQGFGAAMDLANQGRQQKRQEEQDAMQQKLFELKLAQAQMPDMAYDFNPVTGEYVGTDRRTGQASIIPIGQAGSVPQMPSSNIPNYIPDVNVGSNQGDLPMPQFASEAPTSAPQPQLGVPGMTPKDEMVMRQEVLKRQAQRAYPTPQEEEKMRELDKQAKGKIEMAAETKRLIDELLLDKDAIRSAVGPISSQLTTVLGSTSEAENKIRRLRNLATADNLKLMSGVLSESDIKILADLAGGQYDLTRDDTSFINDLKRAQASMNKTLFSNSTQTSAGQSGGVIDFNSLPD